ncbi:MAG: hypothetical protein FWC01_04585 [Treponema sp.]|nr:hypothetical protein [Treponema sp.]MCL2237735.1 hypothetical protein [Treponema sp.]
MKKFFITLLILLIIAGTGFALGWVQFAVPPGQFGVIHSKTHGIDAELVRSGEFRWVWYKLIPTNVKIAIFNLEQKKFPLNFKSSLPSGSVYASFAGLANADFTWDLNGEINFTVNPEMLVFLSQTQSLTNQEELESYLEKTAREIEVMILRVLSSSGTDSERLENLMSGNPDPDMEREVKTRFPEILEFSISIHNAKYPDFLLYRVLRRLYEDFLSSQREVIANSFAARAEEHIRAQLRFEELERYGDLLTRFPVLLEYIALENDIARNE